MSRYNGVRILGLGGSHRYRDGKYMFSEGQMRRRIHRLCFALLHHKGIDILPDFVFFRADPYVYEKDTLVIYIGAGLSEVNYIPFKSIVEQFEHSLIYGIFQTLSNIALLIPYAFLSRLMFKSFTTKKTVIVGILISCAIEMIQFFEPRSMDMHRGTMMLYVV